MIVDCDSCEVRGDACGECVIGVLLGVPRPRTSRLDPDAPGHPEAHSYPVAPGCPGALGHSVVPPGAPIVQLDAPERRAIDVLAEQGLVPRLRLVATRTRRATAGPAGDGSIRDAV